VIDESKLPPLEVRPYDIAMHGEVVFVRMHKRFDTLEHAWNWARDIVACLTDRPQGIDIDIGGCANVSSMFFAGLLLLRDTYKPMPMRLLKVQDRVYRTLQVMCMDNLFEIHLDGGSSDDRPAPSA
jgi:anti-anti-sigma regulatory factor